MTDKSLMLLALCLDLSRDESGVAPLTVAEFHKLVAAIDAYNGRESGAQMSLFSVPSRNDFDFALLGEAEPSFLTERLRLPDGLAEKIVKLRCRTTAVSFELDRFDGIMKTVTVFDDGYPDKLRRRLAGMPNSQREPPFFLYAGDLSLLALPYAGFVGARTADEGDAAWTRNAVERIQHRGKIAGVVSGGAEGVDCTAECAALELGMPVVEFAKSMRKRLGDEAALAAVREGRLLLLSEVNPFRRLSRHEATAHYMGRNKYIYAQAEYTVVVRSDVGPHSGTWSGAVEALDRGIGKLYVRNVGYEGNCDLLQRGCVPIS